MFKTPKPFLVVLLVLLAFVALAQNTVIKQFTDIYIVNDATNAVALKVIKPIANLAPFITLGSQTNEVFSVSSTGLVRAAAFAGDGSQLTGISGGGGSSNFDPFVFVTNGVPRIALRTNLFNLSSPRFKIDPTAGQTNFTILDVGGADYAVGFIRVIGTNSASTDRCDILLHIDALPKTLASPAICQFQGALAGGPFSMQLSHDTGGGAKITLTQHDINWHYEVEGYGENLGALELSAINEPDVLDPSYATPQFYAVNGQIAANQLLATGFGVLNMGSTMPALSTDGTFLQIGDAGTDTKILGPLVGDLGITVSGGNDLRLGNTAVAETPTATHTIIIKDAAGVSYRVLAVPVE